MFRHDLASSHTAKIAKELIDAENINPPPMLPAGADLNPPDVYLGDSVKNALKGAMYQM